MCVAYVYKIGIKSTATNFQVETWKQAPSEGGGSELGLRRTGKDHSKAGALFY